MNVANVLRDIFMVILIMCNGTHFSKKRTQSFSPRMPIGPHVAKHVVQTQEALVCWEIISSLRGVGSNRALH